MGMRYARCARLFGQPAWDLSLSTSLFLVFFSSFFFCRAGGGESAVPAQTHQQVFHISGAVSGSAFLGTVGWFGTVVHGQRRLVPCAGGKSQSACMAHRCELHGVQMRVPECLHGTQMQVTERLHRAQMGPNPRNLGNTPGAPLRCLIALAVVWDPRARLCTILVPCAQKGCHEGEVWARGEVGVGHLFHGAKRDRAYGLGMGQRREWGVGGGNGPFFARQRRVVHTHLFPIAGQWTTRTCRK